MSYNFRLLLLSDYECYKKHINSEFTQDYFINFLKNILDKKHYIMVVEKDNNIIGSGTLFIEEKLTYGGCRLGHIENILINETERGKHIGINLVNKLIEISNFNKCYRIDLICSDDLINYYKKINFSTRNENAMSIILKHNFN